MTLAKLRACALLLALAGLLGGCLPTGIPNPFADTGGSARVSYGVASGDPGAFALAPFTTRYARAEQRGSEITLTLEEAGRDRVLRFLIAQPGPAARSCPLQTGTPAGLPFGCSLTYLQATPVRVTPDQAVVRSGTLQLTESAAELTFSFEAVLEAPSGGTFTVTGSGRAELLRRE
jgi:hypothetical protein